MTRKKIMPVILSLIVLIILVLIIISCYFFVNHKLKFYDVYYLETTRDCYGQFWMTITNEKLAEKVSSKYDICIPENDYTKYNLIISDGREITSIKYNLGSKFFWQYDVPKGIEEFSSIFHEHTMICYKTDKILLKQDGD